MNVWPASLPQHVRREGYQSGVGDGRARSQTDVGVAKLRRRFSVIPRPLVATVRMTTAQLDTFKSFVNEDLAGGSLPFQIPAIDEDGIWIVQFGQNMPTWVPSGNAWMVRLDLVILP